MGTRTGAWPADTTTTGPDDTTATDGGAFADRDVTSAGQDATSPGDPADDGYVSTDRTTASPVTGAGRATGPAVNTDPTRATVPDLGDPDLDDPDLEAVPDAVASQSTGAVAMGADTTRPGQPATGAHAAPPAGAHAAPPAGTPGSAAGADAAFAAAGAAFVTDADGYRASWVRIQSGFVDDPRGSVTEAAELITQITSTLLSAVEERERTLRGTWDGSGDADTENLRNALRDYRSFFERLIGV